MDQIGHKVCDGESTNYGVTSEAARKDKKKNTSKKKKKRNKITLNVQKQKCISCHYVCARVSVCINKDKKVALQLKKRGGLDKQWVHFKAKKNYCGSNVFVLSQFLNLQKGTGFNKVSQTFQAYVKQ